MAATDRIVVTDRRMVLDDQIRDRRSNDVEGNRLLRFQTADRATRPGAAGLSVRHEMIA
jgi:hypothetical protein